MTKYIIASLKHTYSGHEHISFWCPGRCGYTGVIDGAGQYPADEAMSLNDGDTKIAVPLEAVQKLATPAPYYKQGAAMYDAVGPMVENTRANWAALIRDRLPGLNGALANKPDVFKGTRRSKNAAGMQCTGNTDTCTDPNCSAVCIAIRRLLACPFTHRDGEAYRPEFDYWIQVAT